MSSWVVEGVEEEGMREREVFVVVEAGGELEKMFFDWRLTADWRSRSDLACEARKGSVSWAGKEKVEEGEEEGEKEGGRKSYLLNKRITLRILCRRNPSELEGLDRQFGKTTNEIVRLDVVFGVLRKLPEMRQSWAVTGGRTGGGKRRGEEGGRALRGGRVGRGRDREAERVGMRICRDEDIDEALETID
jgi:hypothetical protein